MKIPKQIILSIVIGLSVHNVVVSSSGVNMAAYDTAKQAMDSKYETAFQADDGTNLDSNSTANRQKIVALDKQYAAELKQLQKKYPAQIAFEAAQREKYEMQEEMREPTPTQLKIIAAAEAKYKAAHKMIRAKYMKTLKPYWIAKQAAFNVWIKAVDNPNIKKATKAEKMLFEKSGLAAENAYFAALKKLDAQYSQDLAPYKAEIAQIEKTLHAVTDPIYYGVR